MVIDSFAVVVVGGERIFLGGQFVVCDVHIFQQNDSVRLSCLASACHVFYNHVAWI